MSDIPTRLLNGGARLKFLPDGKIMVCIDVATASADPKLAPLGEVCSPPIDVAAEAKAAGVVIEGAFARFISWIQKKAGT